MGLHLEQLEEINVWEKQGEMLVAVGGPPNLEESSWGAGKLKLTGRWNPLTKTVNVTLKSLRLSLVDICPVHVLKQGCDMINGLCQDELGLVEPRSPVNQEDVIVNREEGASCG